MMVVFEQNRAALFSPSSLAYQWAASLLNLNVWATKSWQSLPKLKLKDFRKGVLGV